MPPNTVRGMVTRPQMTRMMTIVPKGSAAVERYAMATVVRKENMAKKGPQ
jgi:hypothetical protein